MNHLTFNNVEEAKNWIEDNITQNDPRYLPDLEELDLIAQAIYNNAITVEDLPLPEMKEPSLDILNKIPKPQENYKYIALELLKSHGINEIKVEYPFYNRRPDLLAKKEDKTIFVECCSLYLEKVFYYLEEPNSELWVITEGFGPWDRHIFKSYFSSCFVLKKGPKWNEFHENYNKYWNSRFRNIHNILDV